MAKCTHCGSETELYSSGVPICVTCSHDRDSKRKPAEPEGKRLPLAQCAYCGIETMLHISNVPVCTQCADLSPDKRAVRTKLFDEWSEAVKQPTQPTRRSGK